MLRNISNFDISKPRALDYLKLFAHEQQFRHLLLAIASVIEEFQLKSQNRTYQTTK